MKKYFLNSVFIILISLTAFNKVSAYDTHYGGNVSGTWSSGTTHYIIGAVTIQDNSVLTIEAGCVIKFSSNAELIVYGTLDINGTSGNYATFTSMNDNSFGEIISGSSGSPNPGDWKRIFVYGRYDNDGYAYFDYCRVRYGGGGSTSSHNIYLSYCDGANFSNSISEYSYQDGINLYSSYPTINNSVISNNLRYGLFCDGDYIDATAPTIVNNVFNNNSNYAAYLVNTKIYSYSGNSGSGNGKNGIGIQGEVRSNITLSCGSSTFPFILIGRLTVQDDRVLTFAPGTIIKAANVDGRGGELYVYGTVNAIGTQDSTIVFTSLKDDSYGGNTDGNQGNPVAGDWYGILLNGSYSSNYEGTGNFEYCRVRYGGNTSTYYDANIYYSASKGSYFKNSICEYSAYYGINIYQSYPNINSSTISNCFYHGIYAHDQSTEPTIINNTFNNNLQCAVLIINTTLQSYSGNTGSGNGTNGLVLQGTVASNQIWRCGSNNFPFVLSDQVTVNDNVTLTISPGTIIKAVTTGYMYISGTLYAVATNDSNIVFTSIKDDTYGGDTNGDGSASLPSRGDWCGLYFYGYSDNDGIGSFNYCRIRFGGNSTTTKSNLRFYRGEWNGSTFYNSISEYSSQHGIYIYDGVPNINNCIISNNSLHGIFAESNYRSANCPYITNNNFLSNGNYAVYLSNVRAMSYSGNIGSGNGTNEFGISGYMEDTPINWSGTESLPISFVGNFEINSGKTLTFVSGILRCRTYNTSSSGNFILNSGSTIEIGSNNGIASSGSTGNIQNSGSRSFSSEANYIYNGSVAQITGSGLPSSVKNLVINNSGGNTVSLTNNLTIDSTMTITKGSLNLNSKSFQYNQSQSTVLIYNGSTVQTTSDNEFPSSNGPSNLRINNSSCVNLHAARGQLNGLILDNGLLNTSSSAMLILSPSCIINQNNPNSFVNGPLRWSIMSLGLSTRLFPIGKDGIYRPVELTVSHNTNINSAQYTAEMFNSAPPTNSLSGSGLDAVSSVRYYSITKSDPYNVFQNSTIKLNYSTNDLISDTANLRIAKDDGSGNWINIGGLGSSSPIGHITSDSFTSMSDFVLSNATGGNNSFQIAKANLKFYLHGPFKTTYLDTALKINNLIPVNQPYSGSPWNYNGTESVTAIPNGVVDWILIEARKDPTTVLSRRACFLLSDGSVVDTDGVSKVNLGIGGGNYYIVLRHRNHIPIMTSNQTLVTNNSVQYDFTTSQTQAYGTNPMKELTGGVYGLFAGDGNANGSITATDKNSVWRSQNGTNGYLMGDYNLSGGVTASDANAFWRVNNGKSSQIP
jgi:parallel beta-helix repeat protein